MNIRPKKEIILTANTADNDNAPEILTGTIGALAALYMVYWVANQDLGGGDKCFLCGGDGVIDEGTLTENSPRMMCPLLFIPWSHGG